MTFMDTWLTGFTALSVGLVGGAIAVARLIKRGSAGVDLDMELNDLDEQLEHMVAQLRDIEQQKERISEGFYA
ncbi:MAG: hypothetical protein AAF658_22830, partial [Myxococcota bacterium]